MPVPISPAWVIRARKALAAHDRGPLLLSIALQFILALLFGHVYDMRIFMATGYLVGTGQNPYIAQDLSVVFNNRAFHGITSVGYPPPWPLVLGLVYQSVYTVVPNLLIYNLAIKIPVIMANISLAYLVADILKKLGADAIVSRRAWVFLLLNPFLLYFASAWGQFDSIVALLSLEALVLLHTGKLSRSAVLLALAVSFKPTAMPLVPVALVYLIGGPFSRVSRYSGVFFLSAFLFCVAPFIVFGWSPTPILQNWNAHFTVGGGISYLTFFELLKNTDQLPGLWWLIGLAWLPALGIGIYALKPGIAGFEDLLKKSTGLILVFFLTRTWLSEPNIVLVLPLVLILNSLGHLDGLALTAVWTLPLIFTVFNGSLPQLLFLSFPDAMGRMLNMGDNSRTASIVARTIVVIPWQVTGWWIVVSCFRRKREGLADGGLVACR